MQVIKDNYKLPPEGAEPRRAGLFRKFVLALVNLTSRSQNIQAKIDRYH